MKRLFRHIGTSLTNSLSININSIQTVRDRLVSLGASFQMMEVKDGVSLFRNPVQTMDKLPQLIPGLVKNPMLNRDYWIGSIEDLEAGMMPVYVPNLLDSSSRMLDKVTLNTIIRQALPDLADLPVPVKRVIVYYIDAEDLDELRQFIKEQNRETLIEVELRDLKFILDQVVMEDEAEWTLSQATDELFGGWCLTIDRFRSDRLQQIIDAQNQKSAQQDTAGKARHTWIQLSEEGLEGFLVAFNNKIPAMFLGIVVAELNHLLEFPPRVDVHEGEGDLAGGEGFLGEA